MEWERPSGSRTPPGSCLLEAPGSPDYCDNPEGTAQASKMPPGVVPSVRGPVLWSRQSTFWYIKGRVPPC